MYDRDPWGPPTGREGDRDPRTVSLPSKTAASRDREPVSVDREGEAREGSLVLDAVEDMRLVQDASRTTLDKIDFAREGAYTTQEGIWRHANVVFVYLIAAPGTFLCDAIRWALFDKLSRFLLALPVLLAVTFFLNRIPLIAFLVPDQWDVSTWLPQDPPGTVVVPVDPLPGEAAP